MRNKKGEQDEGVLPNVLGTVLALIIFIIVIGGVYLALTQIRKDVELESAKAIADELKARIDALEAGESTNATIQGFRADDGEWYIHGWDKNSPTERPEKCFLKSCVCVCAGTYASDCQSHGICRYFEGGESVEVIGKVISKRTATVVQGTITTSETTYVEEKGSYIKIPSNLLVIELTKTKDKITLSHYDRSYAEDKITD